MDQLEIMYLGRKANVTISPDFLPEPLTFIKNGSKAVLREDHANRLVELNPKMFLVTKRISEEDTLSDEEKEALFSDEGLEGAGEAIEVHEPPAKPVNKMNKTELKEFAATTYGLLLDPDELTKKEMLAKIEAQP